MSLPQNFYSETAVELAPLLLGKFLCRFENGVITRAQITETECYFGEEDTACHAHKGMTSRNAIMYGEGGFAYIYLCYGIHSLLNIVTGAAGHPEAVLIRAVEGAEGPGRLTKLLHITRELNGEPLFKSERLWLEDGVSVDYKASPRIGIAYATEEYRKIPWRFTAIG